MEELKERIKVCFEEFCSLKTEKEKSMMLSLLL